MVNRSSRTDLEIVFENTITLVRSFLKHERSQELTLARINAAITILAIFLRQYGPADPRAPLEQVLTYCSLFATTSVGILKNTKLRPELKLAYLNRQCHTAETFCAEREERLRAEMLAALKRLADSAAQPPTS